jgi:hypothetical protein
VTTTGLSASDFGRIFFSLLHLLESFKCYWLFSFLLRHGALFLMVMLVLPSFTVVYLLHFWKQLVCDLLAFTLDVIGIA